MTVNFISTLEIINSSWRHRFYDKNFMGYPPSEEWKLTHLPDIKDINVWEEIYYSPGVIGIYAAWDPYYEFFILDFPFLHSNIRFKKFYGPDASTDIINAAKKYGINLPLFKYKIS